MKKALKIIITTGLLVFVFLMSLHPLSLIFTPKGGEKNEDGMMGYIMSGYRGEAENTLDVVFCGNSDMYYGFSPMEMWKEYGIPSYTIGQPWQNPKMAYKRLQDVLKYQTPKLLVLEVDGCFTTSNGVNFQNRTLPKKIIDNLKNFKQQFAQLDDGLGTVMGFQFPIFRYHGRWPELTKEDFTQLDQAYHYVCKGYVMEGRTKPYPGGMDYMRPTEELEPMDAESLEYLNKIVEMCQAKDIQLMLLTIPSASSWNNRKHNTMQSYADEKGISFVDMNVLAGEIGLDWSKDTKDMGNHLNLYGMQKVTSYVSRYLHNNYALPDRRGTAAYQQWEKDAFEYEQKKEAEIKSANAQQEIM